MFFIICTHSVGASFCRSSNFLKELVNSLQRYGYFPNLTSTLTNIAKNTPYVRKWAVQKLILQFVCTYYLGLLPKVHPTILSIQIQDSPPVERECFFGVPAPGLSASSIMIFIVYSKLAPFTIN